MSWHGKYRTLDCLCHIELRVMPDD